MIKTLAIETSCDDTSIGIISFDGKTFLVEEILAYSQVPDHQIYWGVVPEIASRLHSEKIIKVLENIGYEKIKEVDFIIVTSTPWLPGSLVVGKTVANLLWSYFGKEIVEVNHIFWHIFSLFLERNIKEIKFPMAVLTASWWHNNIYIVDKNKKIFDRNANIIRFGNYYLEQIGQSIDDAAGECFDKVSRMLWWPYPGWVWISQKAFEIQDKLLLWIDKFSWFSEIQKLEDKKFDRSLLWTGKFFKRVWLSHDKFEFSFSGVKSQVYVLLKLFTDHNIELTDELISVLAYEFQESVVETLSKKLVRAALKYQVKTLWLSGGVSANERLHMCLWEVLDDENWLKNQSLNMWVKVRHNFNFHVLRPLSKVYCTDNSAMIWVVWILKKTVRKNIFLKMLTWFK